MNLPENVKNEIIYVIVKNENPLKIILFGSYAYGNPNENSDIDLLIIKEKVKSKMKEAVKVRRLLDLNFAFDILVTAPEEFEFYKNECGSIYKEIYDKGKVIYG